MREYKFRLFVSIFCLVVTAGTIFAEELVFNGGATGMVLADASNLWLTDVFAIFSNPALIPNVQEMQIGVSSTDLYGIGIKLTEIALGYPIWGKNRSINLGFSEVNYQTLEAKEKEVLVGSSYPLGSADVGFIFKGRIFSSTDPSWQGQGCGIDLGLITKGETKFSFTTKDVLNRFRWKEGHKQSSESIFKFGVSSEVGETLKISSAIAFTGNNNKLESLPITLAVEKRFDNNLTLRASILRVEENYLQLQSGMTLNLGGWNVDYGAKLDRDLGVTHMFSATINPLMLGL